MKKLLDLIVASFALPLSFASHAGLLSGFESGMDGWDFMGDVSIQTSAIGLAPTQAEKMVFISTMCDRFNPPTQSRCEITVNEHPYSGISSPASQYGRAFLGLPVLDNEFLNTMPYWAGAIVGESGAIKTRFFAQRAGVLSFDWNHIGEASDTAHLTLWSDDESYRFNDWIYESQTFSGSIVPSAVELCTRYYGLDWPIFDDDPTLGCRFASDYLNRETGWSTRSIAIAEPGWYWIGFGLGEVAEGTVPSILALDNLRFQVVPEPSTLALAVLGFVGLGFLSRRKSISASLPEQ